MLHRIPPDVLRYALLTGYHAWRFHLGKNKETARRAILFFSVERKAVLQNLEAMLASRERSGAVRLQLNERERNPIFYEVEREGSGLFRKLSAFFHSSPWCGMIKTKEAFFVGVDLAHWEIALKLGEPMDFKNLRRNLAGFLSTTNLATVLGETPGSAKQAIIEYIDALVGFDVDIPS